MKHRSFWARFFLVASLLTAAMIFWFSAQQGDQSQTLSDSITIQVAQILKPGFSRLSREAQTSYLEQLSLFIRKNAHFCEFALLGFNLMCYLRLRYAERPTRACQLPAWIVATLYAGTDELHQMFISERNAAVLDVAIDSAGSLTGVLLATLVLALVLRCRGKE